MSQHKSDHYINSGSSSKSGATTFSTMTLGIMTFSVLDTKGQDTQNNRGVGKTTLLLSATFRRIFIAIKRKNSGE
jgi:hypothetical protein